MAKQLQQQGEQSCSIHSADASARSIATGDAVRMFNDRGEIFATAKVTDDVAAGVVLSPMGQWPERVDGGFGVNALTSTRYADIGRAPTFSDTAVQVERLSK
jgi:anaerobic selenocysteine-containing dehydrogenase